MNPLEVAATLRDCIGELSVASPRTLRELAAGLLQGTALHVCHGLPASSQCDRCSVNTTLASLLHTIATYSEQGNAHKLPSGPTTRGET